MARPPKYTPEEIKNNIDEYFSKINKKEDEPPTLIELAHELDLSYSTYQRYREKSGYEQHIKKAEEKVINWWIKKLATSNQTPAGIIFWLKNRAGFADRVEHQHTGQIEHSHSPKLESLEDDQLEALASAFSDDKDDVIDVTPEDD